MNDINLKITCIKIVFLGDSSVGKTSICNVIAGSEFQESVISTIGADKFQKKVQLKNGKEIKVSFWDTAGEERFKSVGLSVVKNAQGIVFVFDLNDKSSFDNVKYWLLEAKGILDNPCAVLFGNKNDQPKDQWKVTIEEAQEFAKKNNMKFFETSAKTKEGLDEGFSYIVNQIYDKVGKMKDNNVINIKLNEKRKYQGEYEYINGCFGKKKKKKENK